LSWMQSIIKLPPNPLCNVLDPLTIPLCEHTGKCCFCYHYNNILAHLSHDLQSLQLFIFIYPANKSYWTMPWIWSCIQEIAH
jgi:hypothetical protein